MVGQIVFILSIQELIHPGSVPTEYEHLSSKNKSPSNWSKKPNGDFLIIAVTILIKFQVVVEAISLNKTGVLRNGTEIWGPNTKC
jgi:hypothetical protein